MVQDCIDVDDDVMLLGGFGQFDEFLHGSIFCTSHTPVVKLTEVPDVVNVVSDTLQSNIRLETEPRADLEANLITGGLCRCWGTYNSARSERR